jgi:hypothetical protein
MVVGWHFIPVPPPPSLNVMSLAPSLSNFDKSLAYFCPLERVIRLRRAPRKCIPHEPSAPPRAWPTALWAVPCADPIHFLVFVLVLFLFVNVNLTSGGKGIGNYDSDVAVSVRRFSLGCYLLQ